MGELVLQVHLPPSQDAIESYVKNETIEHPPSEFHDSMQHVQRITDVHRSENDHIDPSFAVCVPPQTNQEPIVDCVRRENDSMQHVQMITDVRRSQNDHIGPSFVVCVPPQTNQEPFADCVRLENESPVPFTISTNEQESENKPQNDVPKNPPRKRKEVVFEPPPYEIIPPQKPKYKSLSFDDLPPPYDPSLRRSAISIISIENEVINTQNTSSGSICNLDFLIQLGFCFCSVEQIIVTIAIVGTFIFLALSY